MISPEEPRKCLECTRLVRHIYYCDIPCYRTMLHREAGFPDKPWWDKSVSDIFLNQSFLY